MQWLDGSLVSSKLAMWALLEFGIGILEFGIDFCISGTSEVGLILSHSLGK